MTVPGWGRLVPLQMYMLNLAGVVFGPSLVDPDDDAPTEDQKKRAIALGRHRLTEFTGSNFGFDLLKWHEYLLECHQEHYCHSYAWHNIHSAIESAIVDPDRLRLVQALEQDPIKLSSEGLAVAIVEALIVEGVVSPEYQRIVPIIRDEIQMRKILGEY